jgi:hypothetical protein
MQITRRRVLDAVTAVAGVTMLALALLVFDYRTRQVSAGDFDFVTENVNYMSVAVTLMVAQIVRGEFTDQTSMLLFTTTAVVLVMLLLRL